MNEAVISFLKTIIPPTISLISIVVSAIIVRIKSQREREYKKEEELFNLIKDEIKDIKAKLIDPKDFITREEFNVLKSKIDEISNRMKRK